MKKLEKTQSICPECFKDKKIRKIDAYITEQDGKIWIEKECPIHGHFKSIYFNDAKLYHKWMKYQVTGRGVDNVEIENLPGKISLYPKHCSQTLLANLMVTNRCNLRCSYCFMNAGAAGYIYEPSLEMLKKMMQAVRLERPVPCKALQLTGGEPCIREDLIEIIKMAKDMGFVHIQLNTNGIRLSEEPEYCKKIRAAGVNTVYMSCDGVSPETNSWFEQNKKAIENLRKANLGVVLVPTVIADSNLKEAGDIVKFAIENIDIVRGVNFQPISFCGRAGLVSDDIRKSKRVDYVKLFDVLEKSFDGQITREDFYPVPFIHPISLLVEKLKGAPQVEFTAHPGCGGATYLFIDGKKIIPITRFINVEKMMEFVQEQSKASELFFKTKLIALFMKNISDFIIQDQAPKNLDVKKILVNVVVKSDYKALGEFHLKTLFVGSMWFQDVWNVNIERLKRCLVHYSTPEGIVPFCIYNGLGVGDAIRKRHSISIKQWEEQTGKTMKDDLWKNGPLT
jgi:uncharacterized radical SAM superfamily Fe-S cluster-containing enzyme